MWVRATLVLLLLAPSCGRELAPPPSVAMPLPRLGGDTAWKRIAVPARDTGAGSALVVTPDGALGVVTPSALAVTRDEGASWEVRLLEAEELFTTTGDAPFVTREHVEDSTYAHAPIEPVLGVREACFLSTEELLVVASGRASTRLAVYVLDDSRPSIARTYLAQYGGRRRTTRSYSGPMDTAFGGAANPVCGGQINRAGVIYRMADGGARWVPVLEGPRKGALPLAVACPTDATAWVLWSDGVLFRSDDGAASFRAVGALPVDLADRVTRMVFTQGGRGYLYGPPGVMLTTPDGGHTLARTGLPVKEALETVVPVSDAEVWAAGRDGSILSSRDAGRTWEVTRLPVDAPVRDLVVSRGAAWVLAGGSVFRQALTGVTSGGEAL